MPTSGELVAVSYGYASWAYNNPELRPIFDQAAAENWDEARIVGAISATGWWRTTEQNLRQWQQITSNDPATAQAQRNSRLAELNDLVGQWGVQIPTERLNEIVEGSLAVGASYQQLVDMVGGEILRSNLGPGGVTATQDQLRSMARQYLVPVSDETLSTWAANILAGSATEDGFQSYMIESAKTMFPALTAALDAGQTVSQYVDPYRQIAARELGINPNSIDFTDSKWSRAIHQMSDQGPVAMNIADWIATLRTDPVYDYDKTTQGQEAAYQLSNSILQRMGFVG